MNNITDLTSLNAELKDKSPIDIIKWGLKGSLNPIITTNFRPYEAAILHLAIKAKPDIKVVWCDTGYNTKATYLFAEKIISELELNILLYVPRQTKGYRSVFMGDIPDITDPQHKEFTYQVKLEPFRRAMSDISPDLWITNLRKGQTKFRDTIGIASKTKDGLLKLSPFYFWSDKDLDSYMKEHRLKNEFDYFDPTKVEEKRECGLHE